MSRLTVTGPFYQTTFAEVPPETAQRLLDGSYDKLDCRYDVEEFNTWRSIYGAEEPSLFLDDEELMESSDFKDFYESQEAENTNVDNGYSYPDGMYPENSVFLDKQPSEKYYFICRELYEGDEHSDFEGDFDKSKLKVNRVSLFAGEEIADVFMVNYEEAEIVDETTPEYDGFWLYHDGVLTELD